MKLAADSIAGPRSHNEDNYYYKDLSGGNLFVADITAFIVVSDGMGGYQGGEVASKIACDTARDYVEALLDMVQDNQIKLDVAQALQEIVQRANEAILSETRRLDKANMGATFVGAFLSPTKAWIAHVGDSRAYRVHRGKAEQITTDHSVVGRLLAEGTLTEAQAQKHPKRNVIERALGFNGEEAEIDEATLAPGDVVLLCSDGVSTVVSAKQMARTLATAKTPEEAATALTSKALSSDTDDNCTVLLAAEDWDSFKAQVPQTQIQTQTPPFERFKTWWSRPVKRQWLVLLATVIAMLLTLTFMGNPFVSPEMPGISPESEGEKLSREASETIRDLQRDLDKADEQLESEKEFRNDLKEVKKKDIQKILIPYFNEHSGKGELGSIWLQKNDWKKVQAIEGQESTPEIKNEAAR
ncbi:MAG: protein phosphatase 2C domain-containing protein [Actinomycetes bacterium]|jgi:serine/threonine protein phosphatase PrpC|nr:protein phosphatase 2C domain-containing protein [Actinomycetes bacterium]